MKIRWGFVFFTRPQNPEDSCNTGKVPFQSQTRREITRNYPCSANISRLGHTPPPQSSNTQRQFTGNISFYKFCFSFFFNSGTRLNLQLHSSKHFPHQLLASQRSTLYIKPLSMCSVDTSAEHTSLITSQQGIHTPTAADRRTGIPMTEIRVYIPLLHGQQRSVLSNCRPNACGEY